MYHKFIGKITTTIEIIAVIRILYHIGLIYNPKITNVCVFLLSVRDFMKNMWNRYEEELGQIRQHLNGFYRIV